VKIALAGHFSATDGRGGQRRVPSWRSVTLAPASACAAACCRRAGWAMSRWPDAACRSSSAARRPMRAPASVASTAGCWRGCAAAGSGRSGGEKTLRTPPLARFGSDSCRPRAAGRLLRRAGSLAHFLSGLTRSRRPPTAWACGSPARCSDIVPEKGAEIVSDATVPGSIQVPGQGQPIVLLADGQTAGGYPKIATVISADLPRLAVMAPGQSVRFAAVSVAAAEQARGGDRRRCAR
jgi:hypothetical protein